MSSTKENRKSFMMLLLAFLIAFFIVSLVEVLRSSFYPKGPDVQLASAVAPGDVARVPMSFADLAERLKRLQPFPIRSKLVFVKTCPFPDETPCPGRAQFSGEVFSGEIECRRLPLVLNVKMRRFMIIEEHSNDDSKKRRDYRYRRMLPPAYRRASDRPSNGA